MSARSLSYGSRYMIVSGHPLATTAGLELLQEGGSVVDAAIAAAAVLAVVLPQACTVGGDAFMLIHRAHEGSVALNGSGACPADLSVDSFPDGIPGRGPTSATVPALVRAWHEAHRRFGRREWAALFRRAIQHAAEGFPLSDDVARSIKAYHALLETDPGCTAAFLRDGGLKAGERFRQEALAATLTAIAQEGAASFFEGALPRALSQYVLSRGGALRASDLARAKAEWVSPLCVDYRGLTVQVAPPNSYGLLLLLQLKLLDRMGIDWKHASDEKRLAALINVWRQAFAAGQEWIADPALSERAARPDIDAILARAEQVLSSGAAPPNPGGTAIVSVADAQGNGVVLVQSVFRAWGAAVLDPGSGVLLNNRLSGFSTESGHPNLIAPGKRPAHTLCPVMLVEDGVLRYLTASPGGTGQTITVTQILTNLLDRQMSIAEAIAQPRWSADLSGNLITEMGISNDVQTKLKADGYEVAPGPIGTPYFGSAQLIERHGDGTLGGLADHRREDCLLSG